MVIIEGMYVDQMGCATSTTPATLSSTFSNSRPQHEVDSPNVQSRDGSNLTNPRTRGNLGRWQTQRRRHVLLCRLCCSLLAFQAFCENNSVINIGAQVQHTRWRAASYSAPRETPLLGCAAAPAASFWSRSTPHQGHRLK